MLTYRLDQWDADAILRRYVLEDARLCSTPSSTGIDELGRLPRQGTSADWEYVLLCLRGVRASALVVFRDYYLGTDGAVLTEVEQSADHATRGPILRWTEWRAVALTIPEIAHRHAARPNQVVRLMVDARRIVTENWAAIRGRR